MGWIFHQQWIVELLFVACIENTGAFDALVTSGFERRHQDQSVPTTNDYRSALSAAESAIEKSSADEAIRLLRATDKAQRSFEWNYLTERADQLSRTKGHSDLVQSLPFPPVQTRYGVLNPTTKQVAFVCRDGSIHLRDLIRRDAAERVIVADGRSAIWSARYSQDGKIFVTGHENGSVLVWNAVDWTVKTRLALGPRPVREIAVSPTGSQVVAEGAGSLELWDLSTPEPAKIADVGPRYNFGEGLAFSPNGDSIATGGLATIQIVDPSTGNIKTKWNHATYTMGLEISLDGKYLASMPRGNINKYFAIFKLDSGEAVFSKGPLKDFVLGCAFSPDGARVITGSAGSNLVVYDLANGAMVLTLKRGSRPAYPSFSADGTVLGWIEGENYCYINLAPKT